MSTRPLLSLAVLCWLGCGGGAPVGTDAGSPVDSAPVLDMGSAGLSLVGTWGTTRCLSPDTNTCDYSVTFGAGGDYTVRLSSINEAPANPSYPGCTNALVATGYTYTTTADMRVTVVSMGAVETVERTGCTDPGQNQPPTPFAEFTPSSFEVPGAPYTLTETEYTLGGPGGIVMTRR